MHMTTIQRRSPVSFGARSARTENSNQWTVVLEYEHEGNGPWLIDLSHKPKWDLQDRNIVKVKPFDVSVPQKPGSCIFDRGFLVNRMNRTQASIWHLSGDASETPSDPAFTDTTEATVLLAITGNKVFSIAEKLTNLDLTDSKLETPFLLQGPFCHVPCQLVVFSRNGLDGTVLLTCSRGYGHDMVHAILEAGAEFGLRPSGQERLRKALSRNTSIKKDSKFILSLS